MTGNDSCAVENVGQTRRRKDGHVSHTWHYIFRQEFYCILPRTGRLILRFVVPQQWPAEHETFVRKSFFFGWNRQHESEGNKETGDIFTTEILFFWAARYYDRGSGKSSKPVVKVS